MSKPKLPNATKPTANHFFISPPERDSFTTSFFQKNPPCPKSFKTLARRQESRPLRYHEQVRQRSNDSAQGTKTRCQHLISWVFSRWIRNDRHLSGGRRRCTRRHCRGPRKRRLVRALCRNRRRPCPQRWGDSPPPCRSGNPWQSSAGACVFR